ncbi:MAG TPA: hypothetical protein PKH24_17435 [Sedimentisphaerales bacterium]|jgi:alpha-L-rhamnosidase|nr:hypothetical protein [Sedimentisphaerales bacterium]HNU28915.1 hypothetical protein [Sedimentisphaerales bacterium]
MTDTALVRNSTLVAILTTALLAPGAYAQAEKASFASAKPIWVTDRQTEMNLFVGFRAAFDCPAPDRSIIRLTASSLYRLYVNGTFVGHGPARGPHGWSRVDEWPFQGLLRERNNVVAVEVAGYNANSYYLLDEPAFLQAEVVCDGTVLASTTGEGVPFDAKILQHRVQKVQRFSFQRPFTEYYRLREGDDRWWDRPIAPADKAPCSTTPARGLLVRRVAYPQFLTRQPVRLLSAGTLRRNVPVTNVWKDRSLTNVGPQLKGYPEAELEIVQTTELQKIRSVFTSKTERLYQPDEAIALGENAFAIADLGTNLTGFLGARVRCSQPTTLYVTFDEILTNDDVDSKRLGCANAVCYELQPGTYRLESFEPYTLRYLKLNVLAGDCQVKGLYLREYANPETDEASFSCSDPGLNQIFEAARQTFRQNAVDIFMDCPSRERAGWLCDSFFTSRVAFDLCGNTKIEKNFLENFLLPARFAHLPEGMLPMCYPADHYDGVFIPNWAIWFVVELEEYQARSGDHKLVADLQPRLQALNDYFQQFKNRDGLLEKLQSWVFVEWSKANSFVQDVSYPSNMLYAAALDAAGRMYDEPSLSEEAEQIRETIRRQSFDGEFFVDNAVRRDGRLEVTRNRSEVCQYFAFFFDVATPKTHAQLWDRLVNQFGPERKATGAFPEVHPANAFVGNYLRFELLSRYDRPAQIKKELADYYLYMADRTGTLWENNGAEASCNHGFASHVAHTFYRDLAGIRAVDTQRKTVRLKIADVGLDWCEGRLMTPQGPVVVRWWKDAGKTLCHVEVPAGYVLQNDSPSDIAIQ